MPYTATDRTGRRKLIATRWLDSEALFAWATEAVTVDTSLLNERRRLHTALRRCYYDPTKTRLGNDALLADSASGEWFETIQKLHSFLSDRTAAERKPGSQKQSSAEETTRSDNNLTRAWNTALGTIIQKLEDEQHLTNRTVFETGLTWA